MIALKISAKVIGETNRKLITNLPIKKAEYAAYIHERWPKFDPSTIDERVWIITDTKELKKFWLTYGHGWWIPDVSKEDYNKGRMPDYREAYRWLPTVNTVKHRRNIRDMSPEEIQGYIQANDPQIEVKAIEDLPPPQFAIDELQNVFPARSFMSTGHTCLFWLSQQRKLSADFLGMAQCEDHVDKEFRDLADDRLYIVNWGRKQKSFFRLPKVMTWSKYDMKPGPGVSPMLSGSFQMDIQGIGQCYDTSAGVGIEGGLSADTNEKTPGIHWAWFFVVLFAVLGGMFYFMQSGVIARGITGLFAKSPTNVKATVSTNAPPAARIPAWTNSPAPSRPPAAAAPKTTNTPPRLVGLVTWDGRATAYLDDGTTVDSLEAFRFGGLIRRGKTVVGAKIDGHSLYLR